MDSLDVQMDGDSPKVEFRSIGSGGEIMNNLIQTKQFGSFINNPNAVRSNKILTGVFSKGVVREISKRFLFGFISVMFFCGAMGLVTPQGAEAKKCKAPSAWDQKITNDRFVPAFGENRQNAKAFCDQETGLVWHRRPTFTGPGTDWTSAIFICAIRKDGGRLGWHLPTKEQLASLVDHDNNDLALSTDHPFQIMETGYYWTATSRVDDPSRAWVVTFPNGVLFTQPKSQPHYFWCVRGGQSLDGNSQ